MAGAVDQQDPAANGISKATPKKGGSLVFGVDAEEVRASTPRRPRFDEVGVMYARTVFDPLTIVTADGGWAPYLAQSVTSNAELHRLDHHPAPRMSSSTTAPLATGRHC